MGKRGTGIMKLLLKDVLNCIKDNESEIRKFGVKEIYIFGSVVRGEATDKSDVDIFVDFGIDGTDFFTLHDLTLFLEGKLKTKVDLGTKNALHPMLRDQILREAVRAA
jgi:predicted nucleotidyltransferase